MIPCGNFSRFLACNVAVLDALYASEIIFRPFNLAELLARSRRKIVYLAAISGTLQISPSSRRDFVNLDEISFISARSRRDLRDITNLTEISSGLTRSRRDSVISARSRLSRLDLGKISLISPRSLRDLVYLAEISPRSRGDLFENTNLAEISARSNQSRRNLANLGEISVKYLHGQSRNRIRKPKAFSLWKNFEKMPDWRQLFFP